MKKPRLYVFAISHYCEKARWALDYLGIDHDLKYLAAGPHRGVTRKLGLERSGLPVLVTDERVVQGSADILSWAETATRDDTRRLTAPATRDDCLAIEKRFDDVLGVHTRRYFYSEALVEQPKSLRPVFTRHLPILQKAGVFANWGLICKLMIRGMDLGPEQGQASRRIVDEELRWLDDRLSDGREFVVGYEFSRADIAGASLLAPLLLPPEHPVYRRLELPPKLAAEIADWSERPSFAWARDMYARFR